MATVGCSPVVTYQNSIFDDESKIAKVEDSFTYLERQGEVLWKEAKINFTSFSGTDTIFKIKTDREKDIVFNVESTIKSGDFKLVLITSDNKVINIVSGTEEGSKTISLNKGTSRIKLVGKKAKGEIKINIDADEAVEIEGNNSF